MYDIVAVPADTPLTTPAFTVATAVALLLQLPPAVTQLKVEVVPTVRSVVPVMDATTGSSLFVKTTLSVDAVQGLFDIVHIKVALVPAGNPVTPEL